MPTDPHTMLMRSRELRKNMTREERHLYYDGLKKLPWKFRRQVVVDYYILDFYCPQLRLAIEADGTQHYLEPGRINDEIRDSALNERGIRVLRYSNADINQRFDAVLNEIYETCEKLQQSR